MRNEVLHGYLIHHRKYRERSHIVHLFTQEHGRVDGILRQTPPPQYQPICLQASVNLNSKILQNLKLSISRFFSSGMLFFQVFISMRSYSGCVRSKYKWSKVLLNMRIR